MKRSTLITTLAAAGVAALAPAAADATTYCVNTTSCPGSGVHTNELELGLGAAESHPGPDKVLIGSKATPYVGNFSYASPDEVDLVGAGRKDTVLAPASDSKPTLKIASPASTVSNLGIRMNDAAQRALDLEGTARDVTVTQTGTSGPGTGYGVQLRGNAVLAQSAVTTSHALGVFTNDQNAEPRVEDSSINSLGSMGISAEGPLVVTRSSVRSHDAGIVAGRNGTFVEVDNTLVRITHTNGLIALSGADLTARHVTVVNAGQAKTAAMVLAGMEPGAPTSLKIDSSILSGFVQAYRRAGGPLTSPADLELTYSAWDGGTDSNGTGELRAGPTNKPDTTATFVRPFGLTPNFGLRAPSPLIDAGNPSSPDALDRAGNERSLDGDGKGGARPDMGAFEHAAVPAQPGGGTGPGGAEGDHIAPAISQLSAHPRRLHLGRRLPKLVKRAKSGQLRFRVSEKATVTLRFARKRGGRMRSAGKLRIHAHAGMNRIRFQGRLSRHRKLAIARYRLTAVARDAAGNSSKPKRIRLHVVR